ncbi:MAG TPA: hypothetical protein VG455_16645 [Acidimicrobiales bacterium]|nr:hypothetical protein [Acidimicrobiales bacterium]
MTPTVNLLPASYAARMVERRWTRWVAIGLVLLVALVVLVSLIQSRRVGQAEGRRDTERARTNQLEARRRELRPFAELAAGVVARERLLSAALRTEVSWATVLADLSLSFPADASLTSLAVELGLPAFGAEAPVEPGNEGAVIGTTRFDGYSVREFSPGVETTLQSLAAARGLAEPRLQEGAVEEVGGTAVTTFEGSTFLDAAALTGRYADGLPPEDDIEVPALAGGAVAVDGASATAAGRPSP